MAITGQDVKRAEERMQALREDGYAVGVGLLLTSFFQEEALSPTAMTVPLILLVSAAVSTGHSRQEGRRDKAGSEAAGDL